MMKSKGQRENLAWRTPQEQVYTPGRQVIITFDMCYWANMHVHVLYINTAETKVFIPSKTKLQLDLVSCIQSNPMRINAFKFILKTIGIGIYNFKFICNMTFIVTSSCVFVISLLFG